jgi:hypothetical protein
MTTEKDKKIKKKTDKIVYSVTIEESREQQFSRDELVSIIAEKQAELDKFNTLLNEFDTMADSEEKDYPLK